MELSVYELDRTRTHGLAVSHLSLLSPRLSQGPGRSRHAWSGSGAAAPRALPTPFPSPQWPPAPRGTLPRTPREAFARTRAVLYGGGHLTLHSRGSDYPTSRGVLSHKQCS